MREQATPTPTPTQTGLAGDANANGLVDIVDALLVARYCAGMNPAGFHTELADVNCSHSIDITDALFIARYAAGLIDILPCEIARHP
jgi:hypothetical protein